MQLGILFSMALDMGWEPQRPICLPESDLLQEGGRCQARDCVQEIDRDDKKSGLPKTTGALNDAARETGGVLHYEESCRPLQHPGGEGGFYKSDLTSSFGLLDEEQLWEPLKGDGSAEFDNGGTSSDPRSAIGEGLAILN